MRRIILLAVTACAGSIGLAGCASGPSQVNAAAIVGNTVISVDTVQQELTTILNAQAQARTDQQQGTLDTVSRMIVGERVTHQLVLAAQQRERLTVDQQQVDQAIASSGGADAVAKQLTYDPAAVNDLAYDSVAEESLARAYADRLSVTFDYVALTNRTDAVNTAHQLAANPDSFPSVLTAAKQAGGSGQVGQAYSLADVFASAAQNEANNQQPYNDYPLFGVAAGTVVVYQRQQGGPWTVAVVRQRDIVPATPATTAGHAAANADAQTLVNVGTALLQPIASQLGVRISPRYGVWDPVSVTVVASADQALGVEIPVRTVRS
ncbi:MAG TPA: SurA N-terminal domain-containing protein [Pseudonocardiaceae bacterium]|nr:SurA N-terminal domain-containing protein [Pseudonocardiaceae bacterium]